MAVKEKAKPSFRETSGGTAIDLDDVGLAFNAKRAGPINFNDARNTNYGLGFRMPALQELVPLVYASFENQDYKTSFFVLEALKEKGLMGNTGILYVSKGMYVQDNPEIENGRIFMKERNLIDKLGSREEKGVVFSDDGRVRFTPYIFKIGVQTSSELSINQGVIALANGEENAENIAISSKHYKSDPNFWVLSDVGHPTVRVAGLSSYGSDVRLEVDAYSNEIQVRRFTFGLLEEN